MIGEKEYSYLLATCNLENSSLRVVEINRISKIYPESYSGVQDTKDAKFFNFKLFVSF